MDVAEAIGPSCEKKIIGIRPGEKLHEEMITVSDSFKKETPSMGTQRYLRYKIHLKKYLEKNLNKWNEMKIKNYGSIFIKIK